jgi:transcription elongation factor SPT5
MPAGGDGEVAWLLPDVLVNVLRGGDDGPGVVREVLGVRVWWTRKLC